MTIRAIQIDRHGDVDELQLRQVEPPKAGSGDVLVRTVASSINPVDWKTRAWDRGPAFPMTLGWDLAGIVVEAPGGSGLRPGNRVVAMSGQLSTGRGTWADLVALPAELVVPAPANVALTEAATLPLAGLTAWQAITEIPVRTGRRILVAGAAGAVGALFAQLATSRGAEVDGLVSRAEHVQPVRGLGARHVTSDPAELPQGAYDIVFDTAGLERAGVGIARLLAPGGQYVSITDDPLPELDGFPAPYTVQVREDGPALAELVRLVDAGELRLRVAAHYPIGDVRAAHRRFEAGGLLGKVVLMF